MTCFNKNKNKIGPIGNLRKNQGNIVLMPLDTGHQITPPSPLPEHLVPPYSPPTPSPQTSDLITDMLTNYDNNCNNDLATLARGWGDGFTTLIKNHF